MLKFLYNHYIASWNITFFSFFLVTKLFFQEQKMYQSSKWFKLHFQKSNANSLLNSFLTFYNAGSSLWASVDEILICPPDWNLEDRSYILISWSALPVFKLFLYQINSNRSHLITGGFERYYVICFLRLCLWSICSICVRHAIRWTVRHCLVSILVVEVIHFSRLTCLNLQERNIWYVKT